MRRLFNIAAIAVLALTAMSCQPSLIGEWHHVKTEYYVKGELDEVEQSDEDWVLCFQENGLGYQFEYGGEDSMYWLCKGDTLYIDDDPIKDLERAGCARIKSLDKKELHLERKRRFNRSAVYIFQRVK
jgi:hypothetical protein